MKIQFIYSFEYGQEVQNFPFVLPILQDKETFLSFAIALLPAEKLAVLYKISSCITYYGEQEDFVEPDWFVECNGKLYFKDGNLL